MRNKCDIFVFSRKFLKGNIGNPVVVVGGRGSGVSEVFRAIASNISRDDVVTMPDIYSDVFKPIDPENHKGLGIYLCQANDDALWSSLQEKFGLDNLDVWGFRDFGDGLYEMSPVEITSFSPLDDGTIRVNLS